MSISLLRRVGQGLRHHPALRGLDGLWAALRGPYRMALRLFSGGRGFTARIAGVPLQLHAAFAAQRWETIEVETYRAFIDAIAPGAVVVDVGAHIGTYAMLAALKTGEGGRVIAYEPCEETRRYLLAHLDWNHVASRITVREVCCGSETGTATFFFRDGAEGMNSLVPTEGFESAPMPVVTLDDEMRALGVVPAVIKIDVEGAEFEVLKGAEATLLSAHPTLFISVHPAPLAAHGLSEAHILDWLVERGYRTNVIARDYEVHVLATARQAAP